MEERRSAETVTEGTQRERKWQHFESEKDETHPQMGKQAQIDTHSSGDRV